MRCIERARPRRPAPPAGPTWVYELEAEDMWTDVLYVGVAHDLLRRLRQHRFAKPWWPQVHLVQAVLYATRAEALAMEAMHLNAQRRPLYNLQVPRLRDLPSCAHFSERWLDSVQLDPSDV